MAVKAIIRAKNGGTREISLTPRLAIRLFCISCMGYHVGEVEGCTAPLCELWSFRTGHTKTGKRGNPNAIKALKRHNKSRSIKTKEGLTTHKGTAARYPVDNAT